MMRLVLGKIYCQMVTTVAVEAEHSYCRRTERNSAVAAYQTDFAVVASQMRCQPDLAQTTKMACQSVLEGKPTGLASFLSAEPSYFVGTGCIQLLEVRA